jgi:NitT/TauT family transport system permease protein
VSERMTTVRRGALGVAAAVVLWQAGAQLDAPLLAKLPPPTDVAADLVSLAGDGGYWNSWLLSFERVFWGFVFALALGVPFGLAMATSRTVKRVAHPVFEILRPIPPLAWVPLAILFWPTQELSITFVIFLGAFYTVVVNVLGGAEQIDRRHLLAARSLGARRLVLFRRVIVPAALPSIVTGAVVGMGITWEVVVAAELISGGGQDAADGGLGFLVWSAYQGGDLPRVVVGMISLGVAGSLASGLVRIAGRRLMPWRVAA